MASINSKRASVTTGPSPSSSPGAPSASGGYPAYIGQVATRCYCPNAISGTNTQLMSRTNHIARDSFSKVSLLIPNFYVSTSEQGTGGVATITASIEYGGAILGRFSIGGNTTMTAANQSIIRTDELDLGTTIPRGRKFQIRIWVSVAGGFVAYSQNNGLAQAVASYGDALALGTNVTDLTAGGAVTNASSGGAMFFPLGILASTTQASALLIGDSRCMGQGDTIDASGDTGLLARSIGASRGYINCGIAGDRLTYWIASSTLRRTLMQYVTHCVVQLGTNDASASQGNRTAAQMLADMNTLWTLAKNAGLRVFQTTIDPITTSTDSFATAANQAANANNAARVSVNTTLRTNALFTYGAVLDGVVDTADITESYRDSGLWITNGQASYFTGDGLHHSRNGYLAVQRSGVASPASIGML